MELLCVGDLTVDLAFALPRFPERGGDAWAEPARPRAGGSAANVAAVAARLGLPAAILSAVGQDPWGEWAIQELCAAGVETDLIQRRPEAPTTLVAVLVTADGERTMISARGASRFLSLEGEARQRARETAFFFLSGYALVEEGSSRQTALALLAEARGAGRFCALDPGPLAVSLSPRAVLDALPQVDALLVNEAEAEALFPSGAASAFLTAERPRWVLVKQGARGCWVQGRQGEEAWLPAFAVPTVDPTGAGDAFDAGFLAGLARGLRPTAAALLGNAAGAVACTVWGVIGTFPGGPAVERLLRDALADPAWARWQDDLEEVLALARNAPTSEPKGGS